MNLKRVIRTVAFLCAAIKEASLYCITANSSSAICKSRIKLSLIGEIYSNHICLYCRFTRIDLRLLANILMWNHSLYKGPFLNYLRPFGGKCYFKYIRYRHTWGNLFLKKTKKTPLLNLRMSISLYPGEFL